MANEVGVVLAASRVLGRQGVRAQKGGAYRYAKIHAQAAGHAQLFGFKFQAQAVA